MDGLCVGDDGRLLKWCRWANNFSWRSKYRRLYPVGGQVGFLWMCLLCHLCTELIWTQKVVYANIVNPLLIFEDKGAYAAQNWSWYSDHQFIIMLCTGLINYHRTHFQWFGLIPERLLTKEIKEWEAKWNLWDTIAAHASCSQLCYCSGKMMCCWK